MSELLSVLRVVVVVELSEVFVLRWSQNLSSLFPPKRSLLSSTTPTTARALVGYLRYTAADSILSGYSQHRVKVGVRLLLAAERSLSLRRTFLFYPKDKILKATRHPM